MSSARTDAIDEALMNRLQGGDRSAFALLVRRHQGDLYNFALRQLGNAPAAEAVVEGTFARVARNHGDFKRGSRFSTWVYAIARDLCIDPIGKLEPHHHPPFDEQGGAKEGGGQTRAVQVVGPRNVDEGLFGAGADRERLTNAVHDLPGEQREVFLLRQGAGLSFHQIAEVIGAPENTVKARMRCALEHLQMALRDSQEYAQALR